MTTTRSSSRLPAQTREHGSTSTGRPHSIGAHFEERYRRVDFNTLEVTVTVTDPQLYTRPFMAMRQSFARARLQELEEQLCVPSEAIEYFRTIAQPAGLGQSEDSRR